jgi:hypothetical protein
MAKDGRRPDSYLHNLLALAGPFLFFSPLQHSQPDAFCIQSDTCSSLRHRGLHRLAERRVAAAAAGRAADLRRRASTRARARALEQRRGPGDAAEDASAHTPVRVLVGCLTRARGSWERR